MCLSLPDLKTGAEERYLDEIQAVCIQGGILYKENVPIRTFFRNLSDQPHQTPKETAMEYVSPNPLAKGKY